MKETKDLFIEKQVKAMCRNFTKERLARELVLFYLAFNVGQELKGLTKNMIKLSKMQRKDYKKNNE